MKTVKEKLNELAHTKDYYDKSLDYVVFKEKETLLKLVSPKKRGMETKERKDIAEENYDFDPNADITKLSPKEQEAWEKKYNKMMENENLTEDSEGRKILI